MALLGPGHHGNPSHQHTAFHIYIRRQHLQYSARALTLRVPTSDWILCPQEGPRYRHLDRMYVPGGSLSRMEHRICHRGHVDLMVRGCGAMKATHMWIPGPRNNNPDRYMMAGLYAYSLLYSSSHTDHILAHSSNSDLHIRPLLEAHTPRYHSCSFFLLTFYASGGEKIWRTW